MGVEVGHIHARSVRGSSQRQLGRRRAPPLHNPRPIGGRIDYTAPGTHRGNVKPPKLPRFMIMWDKKPVVNAQDTEAAREKQEHIKERFKEWVWSDDSRRERLCRLYSDTFNVRGSRTFNGEHLTLPGASASVQLHSHQKAGIWRILQTPNTPAGSCRQVRAKRTRWSPPPWS